MENQRSQSPESKVEIIIPATRICSKCKIEKELNHHNFYRQKSNKHGYKPSCMSCSKISDKDIYKENQDLYKKRAKKWNKKNKNKVALIQQKYRENKKKEKTSVIYPNTLVG